MKQQLKWFILACFILTFFGCEPLPPAEKVGAQQKSSPQILNFNKEGQFFPLQKTATAWQQVFPASQFRAGSPPGTGSMAVYRKKFPVEMLKKEKWSLHLGGLMQDAKAN